MKPKIGITAAIVDGKLVLNEYYIRTVLAMDALPVAVPPVQDPQAIGMYVDQMDGWIVSGGADVDPARYGEDPLPDLGPILPDRDHFEIELVREIVRRDKPLLAICRGMQVLNVALGGSLYQDVRLFRSDHLQHFQKSAYHIATHAVVIEPDSRLFSIMKQPEIRTNSMHHQSAKTVAPGLIVSARAKDGIVEAIESPSHRFVLGVQWHPETMAATDTHAPKLFQAWIQACRT